MITIYAGASLQPFYIHHNVLFSSSSYFRIHHGSSETREFRFASVHPSDMRNFLSCLYRRFWKTFLMPAPEYRQDLADNARLYVLSARFGVGFLQGYAADTVKHLLEKETKAYIFGLKATEFAAHLKARMVLIKQLYEGTEKVDHAVRVLLVSSVTTHMDNYYECGRGFGIDMDAYMAGFEEVPEFWRDLTSFAPERKFKA